MNFTNKGKKNYLIPKHLAQNIIKQYLKKFKKFMPLNKHF